MKKTLLTVLSIAMAFSVFAGSSLPLAGKAGAGHPVKSTSTVAYHDFKFKVDPATFDIVIERGGVKEHAAVPLKPRAVRDVKKTANRMEWTYPDDKVNVVVQKKIKNIWTFVLNPSEQNNLLGRPCKPTVICFLWGRQADSRQ